MTDHVTRINDLRQRVLEGETIPADELASAINQIREERNAASTAKKAKTKPKVNLPTDINDLFS